MITEQPKELNLKLIKAITEGDLDIFHSLIEQIDDIHFKDDSFLIRSCYHGRLEMATILIAKGADVHARYNSSLLSACRYGYLDIVNLLIEHGADVTVKDYIALDEALSHGHLPVAKKLIQNVQKENILTRINKILIEVPYRGLPIVQFLIDHGANVSYKEEQTLINASSRGLLDIVKLLIQHGANPHARNGEALQVATIHGHSNVVHYFVLHHNVDITTSLMIAQKTNQLEIVEFFEQCIKIKSLNNILITELTKNDKPNNQKIKV